MEFWDPSLVKACQESHLLQSIHHYTIIQVDVQNTDTPTPTTAQGDQH